MHHIVITGGHGGLGQALHQAFRDTGDQVRALGHAELDVTDPASVAALLEKAPAPDLLVCNAGFTDDRLLARLDAASFSRQVDVNLHGAFRCARAVVKGMIKRRSGHLVFISSRSALHPPAGQAAYASAKAALIGFSHSLARELGPWNIRSNVILPGFLETPMTAALPPDRRQEILDQHCLSRFNTPAEAARFLVYLQHHLPHTSGQVFQLDSRIHPIS
ncbi:MAG: SDR family NAD(P)-dependent oxidoreductase [Akkermansiaceae bacterium]|jgi:3-oxoacyl-[acyl-carrier protein] reductase|nr:SDR family NAD(P)-dependent oxidoreductase [Akkermansiaceae bacterium]